MLINNVKALLIHLIISLSAFYYTSHVQLERNRWSASSPHQPSFASTIYVIILLSSLLLYYLVGQMFLENQHTPSRNLLSLSLLPLLGMLLWSVLYSGLRGSVPFDIEGWRPYLMYIGYTTPVVYSCIRSHHILPVFTWIPFLILYFSIHGKIPGHSL